MALPHWPQWLPFPDRSGYGYAIGYGLRRTPFGGSLANQRRTFFGQPAHFTLAWRMTTQQVGIFQTFVQDHAFCWFSITLVHGAANHYAAGDCIRTKVRLTSDPMHEMIAPDLWRVTAEAEVQSMYEPRAVVPGSIP